MSDTEEVVEKAVSRIKRKFSKPKQGIHVYLGVEGVGKTTGACSYPDAVLIPVENGR